MEHRIIDISLLDPNEGQIDGLPSNPRKWSEDDLSRLEDSIRETPELLEARGIIVVPRDGRYLVLGGNMRLAAIRGLGRTEAPCIVLPETTPAEKLREIVIKDNGSFGEWDMDALANEWDDMPLSDWGVDVHWDGTVTDWTKTGLKSRDGQTNEEYEAFKDKFKPKLTTDDCYTPPEVYDVVLDFIRENVCPLDTEQIIRPFYPGGDYEHENYPDGCIVIDNPPFSILSKIVDFYLDKGLKFFLFAPSLTLFSGRDCTFILTDAEVTYENGAVVRTSFVTNLCGDLRVWVEPTLSEKIAAVQKKEDRSLLKYNYPDNLITAATMEKIAARGLELKFMKEECAYVANVDFLRKKKKGLYGGGFLLSERQKEQQQKEQQQKEQQQKEQQQKEQQQKEQQQKEYSFPKKNWKSALLWVSQMSQMSQL